MKHILTLKQLSNKLKLSIITCYMYSTCIYGAETWTFDKKAEKKIKALSMWYAEKWGEIVWSEKKTNNEVPKQLKLKRELLSTVYKGQIKFFRNIKKGTTIFWKTY
jgi:hypothetical protein